MAIISLKFAAFVLAALIIYLLLPGKWQNLFLLTVSYYYYSTWAWWYVVVLLALTAFNFYCAQFMYNHKEKRRPILWTGIAVNALTLLGFLLGSQFNDSLNAWLHNMGTTGIELAILLPLGFSYRALECISYLVDIYLKIAKPCTRPLDFALYLAYFPKLVSGPLERARKFLPQIADKKVIDNQVFARSGMLIIVGLLRSTVLAGMFTVLPPTAVVMTDPRAYPSAELVLGLLGFAFYLYNQFAGYTCLVRGISGLFGIELTNNFAYPFFSKDFSDFWKRWHISLSEWMRDYIYMPLSRAFLRRNPSRTNKANLIIPPIVTMLTSGLWHGANLHLLVWGGMNGLYIVGENLINLFRHTAPSAKRPAWRALLSSLVLISLALLSAIPFRADLKTSRAFIYQLLVGWNTQIPDLRILIFMAASLFLDWLQFRHNDEFIFLKWPRWAQAILAVLVVFSTVIVYHLQNAPSTFIYP